MKMLLLQTRPKVALMIAVRLVIFIAFSIAGSAAALAVQPADDWQVQRLLQPTDAQRAREQQGHIFIYDGVKDRDVEHAMDQGFDRIGSMMFINVKKTKKDSAGSASDVDEDDMDDAGCE
jgi:hypothetical protein